VETELNYVSQDDSFFDYCHYRYNPSVPYIGKLRSYNLLIDSFDFMKCSDDFYNVVELIKDKIGLKNTVWGFKKAGDEFAWEFYFYNWDKKNPDINISNVLNILKPFFNNSLEVNENLPYFMFSIDITQKSFENHKIEGVHIYIGSFNYFLTERGIICENEYSFFSPKNKMIKLLERVKESAFVDFNRINLNQVLIPDLVHCFSICKSTKRQNDGIYYSRLNINQFLFFLKKFDYPKEIVSFIENNRLKLDHLKYDVGFDYTMEDDKLKVLKSGYYGTF